MGRIVPPFRQLYQEAVSDLQTELKAALVDLGHKSAFAKKRHGIRKWLL
ncbi:MAG: hypothetical protein WBE68_13420 [Candidatus Nitrosopolaris sp.]